MIAELFKILFGNFPKLESRIWKLWYEYLAKFYQRKDWLFMNYGYASLDGQSDKPTLDVTDESNRFSIQLYHHVSHSIGLNNLSVLEVGCGRGGGADYIKRYLKPAKMVGIDFSTHVINFCKQRYNVSGLSFQIGDAESLPFENDSFDVVINVESSYCYSSFDKFLYEVTRVLNVNGYLLFADFRSKEKLAALRQSLYKSNLTLISETDITQNILEALGQENERKTALIKETIHKPFVKTFLEFAGTKDSNTYELFKKRETIYISAVLQKLSK